MNTKLQSMIEKVRIDSNEGEIHDSNESISRAAYSKKMSELCTFL